MRNATLVPRGRLLSSVLLPFALCAFDASAMEVKKYAITDFTAQCGGNDVGSWNNMVNGWYDEMDDEGHSKAGSQVNGNMTLQLFCDPDWNGDCQDDHRTDDADAFVLATHGTDSGDHWQCLMRWSWNGHCRLDGGGSSDEMWTGDWDNEFIMLASCNSADDDNLPGIRNAMFDPFDTPSHGRRAHQWNAFHGVMWISNGRRGDYDDVADDGHDGSISDAWVYNQIDSKQCPVAYAISSSKNGCLTRLNYERYNYVYGDPPGHNWYCWKAFSNCDPDAGEDAWNP